MDHTLIPKPWKQFLETLQTKYPNSVIAGGCLRDLIVGNPIKDVDIFIEEPGLDKIITREVIGDIFGISTATFDKSNDYVSVTFDIRAQKIKQFTEAELERIEREAAEENGYDDEDEDPLSHRKSTVSCIYDVKLNGIEYQLIFIEADPVEHVFADFDIGLCKILFDGFDLLISDEFNYDLDHKQLTFSGRFTKSQMLHTMLRHIPNLKKKFRDWPVVIDDVSEKKEDDYPSSYHMALNAALETRKAKEQAIIDQAEREALAIQLAESQKGVSRADFNDILKMYTTICTPETGNALRYDDGEYYIEGDDGQIKFHIGKAKYEDDEYISYNEKSFNKMYNGVFHSRDEDILDHARNLLDKGSMNSLISFADNLGDSYKRMSVHEQNQCDIVFDICKKYMNGLDLE